MNRTYVPWLNLDRTLNSGQVFNWRFYEDFYYGFFQSRIIKIRKEADFLIWQTYPEKDDFEFVSEYFNLNHAYSATIKSILVDDFIVKAEKNFSGLHILNQPFEQTLFSFILATNKNIPAIRHSIAMLSQLYGKSYELDSQKFYFFPSVDFFYSSSLNTLKKASVGYRAEYLKNAAEKIIDLQNDSEINKEFLLSIKGVGDKVADCVMSFSLKNYFITPIDVWGDRIIKFYYGNHKLKKYSDKSEWFTKKFKNGTAWAGAMLFEMIRKDKDLIPEILKQEKRKISRSKDKIV